MMIRNILRSLACLLFAVNVQAQEKIRPTDFGYNDKVKQVDEIYYKYNPTDKKYSIEQEQSLFFTNGKLTHRNLLSALLGVIEYDNYYTYNSAGLLISSAENINGTPQGKYEYFYKNGKLYSKNGTYKGKKEISLYEYNQQGRLVKVTYKKEDQVLYVAIYSNYKSTGTFKETTTFYTNGTANSLNVKEYQNGRLVAEGTTFGGTAMPAMRNLEYNDRGLVIKASSATSTAVNLYEYDDNRNPVRTMLGGVDNGKDKQANTLRFSKITYAGGLALGTTAFNHFFAGQNDPQAGSFTTEEKLKRPATGTQPSDPFALYNMIEDDDMELNIFVIKNANGSYQVVDDDGKDITASVQRIRAPNNLDLVVYDSTFEEATFFTNFFGTSTQTGVKLKGEYLPESDKGAYFVRVNGGNSAYIIMEGKYLSLKGYVVSKSDNGVDLNVKKDGKMLYVLKNFYDNNKVKDNLFYPVTQL